MKKNIIIVFIVVFLSSQFLSVAWDWDTHRWIAEKICNDFNCQCLSEIKEGSIIPDRDFKDFRNHVYYNPNTCKPSPYYKCPKYFNDAALRKTDYWLNKAKEASGCERWKYIGIASHYFFDSKVIWHQVVGESYYECHKPFEDKVGEKFKYGEKNWTVCHCEQCVSYDDFLLWIEEFKRKLEFLNITCTECVLSKEETRAESINTTTSQQEYSTSLTSEESQGKRVTSVEKEMSTTTIQPQKEYTSLEEEIHTVFVLSIVFIVIIVIGLGYIIFRKFKWIRERKG